jgi:hypothetical protein
MPPQQASTDAEQRQQAAPKSVNGIADGGHDRPGRRGELYW